MDLFPPISAFGESKRLGQNEQKIKSSMFRTVRDERLGSCLGTTTDALSLLSRALISVLFRGELVWKEQSAYAILSSE